MYWEGSYLWGIAGYKTGLLGVRWFIATNHEISLKKKWKNRRDTFFLVAVCDWLPQKE